MRGAAPGTVTAMYNLGIGLYYPPEGRCLAGFSGGADSTALLLLLAAERDAGRCEPEAVHVNHGLRGDESDGDEVFCTEMCARLGIPLHTLRADLKGRRDEDSCRTARFEAFESVMEERGIRKLVLAHNRDDLAETFLMRLMRGAGADGLACMGAKDQRNGYTIFRPMLHLGRQEIRFALEKAGIAWREDSSNGEDAFLRNAVRHRLLPLMEELSHGATERIARTAGILAAENGFLKSETEKILASCADGRYIRTDRMEGIADVLRSRVLRAWWRVNAPPREEHTLSASQTMELVRLSAAKSGKANLPGGLNAVKGRNGIHLTGFPRSKAGEIQYSFPEVSFGDCVITTVPSRGNPGNGISEQEFPPEFLEGCIIRTRKPGDRIHSFGMRGQKKLQDYLTDRGIDEPWRDSIPLLCRDGEVIWACGVGTGAVPLWEAGRSSVRLICKGKMPWIKEEKEREADSK